MAGHGTFVWFELNTDNVAKAKDFYAKTLGWTYSEMPGPAGAYTIIHSGETMIGGMVANMAPPGTPPHWFDYIEVDDVDKRAAAFGSSGGGVLRPPFDIPNVGRIAIVKDPSGAVVGIITSAQR
ncbi:MAG TPA: VOC family protein [Roseiarcus sp.]|nr:VOC family protein [Roseiarcus sp.]